MVAGKSHSTQGNAECPGKAVHNPGHSQVVFKCFGLGKAI